MSALFCLSTLASGCSPQSPTPSTTTNQPATPTTNATLSSSGPNESARPVVLLDSYHAHNFIDRGLIPGEHTYHRFTGLRRAAELLTDRQVEVRELIVGPITSERLKDVQLIVLNLPSMDRPPWLVSEIEAVERFIREGGGMLFITDHTNCYYHQYHVLPLWQRLGLIPTFETVCERAEKNLLSHTGPAWLLIRNFERHPVTDAVHYVGIQTGGRVVGDDIIARSSPDAWADAGLAPLYGEGNPGLTGDLQFSPNEEVGPQGVILAKSIDRGRVVVMSDQNAFGDAFISYADNWRLWLNACNWAGDLKIDPRPLSIDAMTVRPKNQPNSSAEDNKPTFDQIVGGEANRNAYPKLPPGTWQVECWEDLSAGEFHWGSGDSDQYYHLWCWLNRWCWASAHEAPSNPAPSGRVMLLVDEHDLEKVRLQQRLEQVLRRLGGKAVILSNWSAEKETDSPKNAESMRAEWLKEQLARCMPKADTSVWLAAATWHDQPLLHAQLSNSGATLVVIPEAGSLQNASFTAPETAPDAVQSKWQRRLYHWLFEQP